MEAGTRVIVHLVPVGDERPGRDKVRGVLRYPYDGEGPVHLGRSGDATIVPADKVRWVEETQRR